MNVPKIKGTHYAMKSAMLAAEAIWDKIEAGDSSTQGIIKFADFSMFASFIINFFFLCIKGVAIFFCFSMYQGRIQG